MKPILYPARIMTGGGRGKGFKVVKYLPWENLRELQAKPHVWNGISCLYERLAAAYDHFYETCGFLSPLMTALIEERKSYAASYPTSAFQTYAQAYTPGRSDIAEAYTHIDYSETYALLSNQSKSAEAT
jgi:hypothetical protein